LSIASKPESIAVKMTIKIKTMTKTTHVVFTTLPNVGQVTFFNSEKISFTFLPNRIKILGLSAFAFAMIFLLPPMLPLWKAKSFGNYLVSL
jgi:hypothetical protein